MPTLESQSFAAWSISMAGVLTNCENKSSHWICIYASTRYFLCGYRPGPESATDLDPDDYKAVLEDERRLRIWRLPVG